MKTKRKALALALCAVLLVVTSVLGTLAYLKDSATAVNTFTVGNIEITLDEADVNENGEVISNNRVTENDYRLLPGKTYVKDPTVTVKANSEDCYVRMIVTINKKDALDAIFAPEGADLMAIFGGFGENDWTLEKETENEENDTRTYEFRYNTIVQKAATDTKLTPLFKTINVPEFFTGEDLKAIDGLEINIEAHAMQVGTFESDPDGAWTAFDAE